MRKITVTPRKTGRRMPIIEDPIGLDERRRLRNALLALARLDAGWMYWVEKHIPKWESLTWKRRMIERQARVLSTKYYSFIGWGARMGVIYSDYWFTDEGNLKTYR